MSDEPLTRCVLIPCSEAENWAVPQNCLAEIVTINSTSATPPESITWRGVEVPVVDFGVDGGTPWSDERIGTGLVAVFLGLRGEGCEYWGLAVRGSALEVAALEPSAVVDMPQAVNERATAAFAYREIIYQVPDLDGLQKRLAVSLQVA
tara:strand:- start:2073 stop:2519 length:447 start_codon:yes stop_codon:yes gene_type:complete